MVDVIEREFSEWVDRFFPEDYFNPELARYKRLLKDIDDLGEKLIRDLKSSKK